MPERDDIDDLSIGEQIDILLEDLPLPVQKFLTSPQRNAVSLELSRKYNLHADTAGVFERAYIYMLLGVYSPDEFVQELREGGIDEETIKGLAVDVNEQVFKKLREEEHRGVPAPVVPERPQVPVMEIGSRETAPSNLPGQDVPLQPAYQPIQTVTPAPPPAPIQVPLPPTPVYAIQQPQFAPPPAPAPAPPTPPSIPEFAAPAEIPAPSVNQFAQMPPNPAPPPATYAPASPPTYQAPAPAPIYSDPAPQPLASPEAYYPAARTMAGDMELAAQGFQNQSPSPEPAFQAESAPMVYVPPPPAFSAHQPQAPAQPPPASSYPPPAMASVRLTPVERTHADAPITKEYGSDPYREPIE